MQKFHTNWLSYSSRSTLGLFPWSSGTQNSLACFLWSSVLFCELSYQTILFIKLIDFSNTVDSSMISSQLIFHFFKNCLQDWFQMCGTIEPRETHCLGGDSISWAVWNSKIREYSAALEERNQLWPQKPNSSTKNSYLMATFGLAWNSTPEIHSSRLSHSLATPAINGSYQIQFLHIQIIPCVPKQTQALSHKDLIVMFIYIVTHYSIGKHLLVPVNTKRKRKKKRNEA